MDKFTDQMKEWSGKFGKEYTDRNSLSVEEYDARYEENHGITLSEIDRRFTEPLDRSARILELGSNVGNQLILLQNIGFTNLYGIDVQRYAVELSKTRTKNINIIQGSAFDVPFKDNFFDMVFTSGLLIHINPKDVSSMLKEVYRCSKKYIWGIEYYAPEYTEINYRGHNDLLWKCDFAKLYLEIFNDLELVKEERISYKTNDNLDTVFLLRKK
ncbi:MAG: pseudaminic acid biosynthesis-associated methylase [Planctomycetota bacterium]